LSGIFDVNSSVRIVDIKDGTSNTIALGEAVTNGRVPANGPGLKIGQVWSSADFDGTNAAGSHGGHGSVLAVTMQNPGPDGQDGTADDVMTKLNQSPVDVSIDVNPNSGCFDNADRIRGFYSIHVGGAHFAMADGSVRWISDNVDLNVYRSISTMRGDETVGEY
jgi:prepilin-type processing-associated H-X9-DG protein